MERGMLYLEGWGGLEILELKGQRPLFILPSKCASLNIGRTGELQRWLDKPFVQSLPPPSSKVSQWVLF
jgi:hypothetical protein